MLPKYKLVNTTNSLSVLSSSLLTIRLFLNSMLLVAFAINYSTRNGSRTERGLCLVYPLLLQYIAPQKAFNGRQCLRYAHNLQGVRHTQSSKLFTGVQILRARYNCYQLYTLFWWILQYCTEVRPSFRVAKIFDLQAHEEISVSYVQDLYRNSENQREFMRVWLQLTKYRRLLLSLSLDNYLFQQFQQQLHQQQQRKSAQKLKKRIRHRLKPKLVLKLRNKLKLRLKLRQKQRMMYKLHKRLKCRLWSKVRWHLRARLRVKLNSRLRYKIKRRLLRRLYGLSRFTGVKQVVALSKKIFKLTYPTQYIFNQLATGLRQLKSKTYSLPLTQPKAVVGPIYQSATKNTTSTQLELLRHWKLLQFSAWVAYRDQIMQQNTNAKLASVSKTMSSYRKAYQTTIFSLQTRAVVTSNTWAEGRCAPQHFSQARHRISHLAATIRIGAASYITKFIYLLRFFPPQFKAFSVGVPVTHMTWFRYYLSFFFGDYLNSPSSCLFYSHPFFQRSEQTEGFAALQASKAYKVLLRLSNYQLTYYIYALLFAKNIRIFVKWFSRFIESMHFKRHRHYFNLVGRFLQSVWQLGIARSLLKGFFLFFKGKLGRGGSVRKKIMYFRSGHHSFSNLMVRYNYRRFIIRTQSGVVGGQFALFF